MLYISPYTERNLVDAMLPTFILGDSATKDVVTDSTYKQGDIAFIELFNAGANNAYYAYGRDCDNLRNFNGFIVPGQMLRVATRQRVSMFSVGGTTIGITVMKRVENVGNAL